MFYIFCWIVSAIIGALIGNTKGKAASGAIGGMLLGPIGWLFAAMEKDERTKCPECLGAAIPGARKCIHCGSELDQAVSAGKPPESWMNVLIAVAVIFGLLGFLLWSSETSTQARRTFEQVSAELERIKLWQFDRLSTGMNYSQACKVLDKTGTETARNHADSIAGFVKPIDT